MSLTSENNAPSEEMLIHTEHVEAVIDVVKHQVFLSLS